MKKWLFSDNGKVTGPLDFAAAKQIVSNNPNLYAWQPSYSHWMPVNCIEEFISLMTVPKPPELIPSELIEHFITKERDLVAKLDSLDKSLDFTNSSLAEFDQEIVFYKQLTKDCSQEVQSTLDTIEQQYAALRQNLNGFKKAAIIAKSDLSVVSAEFHQRTSPEHSTPSVTKVPDLTEQKQAQELKQAQE